MLGNGLLHTATMCVHGNSASFRPTFEINRQICSKYQCDNYEQLKCWFLIYLSWWIVSVHWRIQYS